MAMDRYLPEIVRKLLVSYNWYMFQVSNTVESSLSLSSFLGDSGTRLSLMRSVCYHVMGKKEFLPYDKNILWPNNTFKPNDFSLKWIHPILEISPKMLI